MQTAQREAAELQAGLAAAKKEAEKMGRQRDQLSGDLQVESYCCPMRCCAVKTSEPADPHELHWSVRSQGGTVVLKHGCCAPGVPEESV